MVDILGYRRKLGVIVESWNSVASPDLAQMALTGVTTHIADRPVGADRHTPLDDAVARLGAKDAHSIQLWLDDVPPVDTGNARFVSPHEALAAAFGTGLFGRRIALLTPFAAEAHEAAVERLGAIDTKVVRARAVAAPSSHRQAHTPFTRLREAVVELLAGGGVDTIVQLGHNLPLLRLVENIEEDTGVPVLAINAVAHWRALRVSGIDDPLPGVGRLLLNA